MSLILGLDVAKKQTAMVVYSPEHSVIVSSGVIKDVTPLLLYDTLQSLFATCPAIDKVVTAPATFGRATILGHARLHGVMELWAEQHDISFFYCHEANAKRLVTGKCLPGEAGKKRTRDHFAHLPELKTQDECDAMMFIMWYLHPDS